MERDELKIQHGVGRPYSEEKGSTSIRQARCRMTKNNSKIVIGSTLVSPDVLRELLIQPLEVVEHFLPLGFTKRREGQARRKRWRSEQKRRVGDIRGDQLRRPDKHK